MAKGSLAAQNFIALLGRVCLAVIFVIAGVQKIIQFKPMMATLTDMTLPHAGMTLPNAEWLLVVAILFELGGGLLLLLGWFGRFGAFLLFIFVIAATYLFHSFWVLEGTAMISQSQHFLKNLSILGGLFYVMAYGSGGFSFDRYRRRSKEGAL